jgi:hypothetical protein
MTPRDDRRPNPSLEHEARRRILKTMAILAGFEREVPMPLIDGTRPDIALIRTDCRAAFLGDAKATEGPHDRSSKHRLAGYVRWARAAASAYPSIIAVCYGALADPMEWERTLLELAADGAAARPETVAVDVDVVVSWIGVAPLWSDRHMSLRTQFSHRGRVAWHIRRP